MKFELKSDVKDSILTQELFKVENNFHERMATWVTDTKEKNIKDALIKLGWIPPSNDNGN